MMRCFVVLVLGAAVCCAKVYTPCELAHYFRFYYSSYIPEKYVPLAVCIAGYHNYSKSNELIHPDGRVFVGYFGLIAKPECPEYRLKDDSYFSPDWTCLKSQILDVPRKLNLYKKLCAPEMVNNLTCRFNDLYEYGEVWDPIHKDIISLSFGDERVIDNILKSYAKEDLHAPISTTTVLQNSTNPNLTITGGVNNKIAPNSQLANKYESTNMSQVYYSQDYIMSRAFAESNRIDQERCQFCFDSTQVSLICILLLALLIILLTALLYVLVKICKNLEIFNQDPRLRSITVPSSPPMEQFLHKSYSEGPTC